MGSSNDQFSVQDESQDSLFDDGEQSESFEDEKTEAEVSNRLDALFGDEDDSDLSPPRENKPNPKKNPEPTAKKPKKPSLEESVSKIEKSPIKGLKSVILSLEWEINDTVMNRLSEEISILEKKSRDDKILVAFLQLLGSLGKYIQKKKVDAHPDSIGLLNSVYDTLENVMLSEHMSDTEKKKLLVGEVNKYKKLKEHIASSKPSVSLNREIRQPEVEKPLEPEEEITIESRDETEVAMPGRKHDVSEPGGIPHNDVIVEALREINRTIKTEFEALRKELQSWRER